MFFLDNDLEETVSFPRSLGKVFSYLDTHSETDVLKTFKTSGVFQTKCILPLVKAFLDTRPLPGLPKKEFNLKGDILCNSFVRLTNTLCK